MSHIFKPEFLGGEYPLDTHVRISYNHNYTHKEDWGLCNFQNNGNFFEIKINIPSLDYIKLDTGHEDGFVKMLYFAIGGHEESHALQFSGNFTNLILWMNKITKRRLSKKKSEQWDKLWRPSKKQVRNLESWFPNLIENQADMAEVSTLLYHGYSKKDIFLFTRVEIERINKQLELPEECAEEIYSKRIMNFLNS